MLGTAPTRVSKRVSKFLLGSVRGRVGWSSEQPGLVEDVPAHGRGVGTRWSLRSLPTLTILWFYDSTKNTLIFGKYGWQPGLTILSTKRKSLLSWKMNTDFKVTNELEQEESEKKKEESTSTVMSDWQFQADTQGEITCYQLLHDQHVHISNSCLVHWLKGCSALWSFERGFLVVLGAISPAIEGDHFKERWSSNKAAACRLHLKCLLWHFALCMRWCRGKGRKKKQPISNFKTWTRTNKSQLSNTE